VTWESVATKSDYFARTRRKTHTIVGLGLGYPSQANARPYKLAEHFTTKFRGATQTEAEYGGFASLRMPITLYREKVLYRRLVGGLENSPDFGDVAPLDREQILLLVDVEWPRQVEAVPPGSRAGLRPRLDVLLVGHPLGECGSRGPTSAGALRQPEPRPRELALVFPGADASASSPLVKRNRISRT
jgi:hypothetical protein